VSAIFYPTSLLVICISLMHYTQIIFLLVQILLASEQSKRDTIRCSSIEILRYVDVVHFFFFL